MPVGCAFAGQYLYRPEFVRRVFTRRMGQDGVQSMIKDRKHQINREMWIGATFALGLMQAGNEPIYCTPGPTNSPPDVFGVSIQQGPKGQIAATHHWEVTEYNEYSQDTDVIDHLNRTKLWKGYGPEFAIVCYMMRPGQPFVPKDAHDHLAAIMKGKTYPAVWALASVVDPTGANYHVIAQLWPTVTANRFVPEEVERTLGKDMKEILKPSFGTEIGFTPLGKKEVRGWDD